MFIFSSPVAVGNCGERGFLCGLNVECKIISAHFRLFLINVNSVTSQREMISYLFVNVIDIIK